MALTTTRIETFTTTTQAEFIGLCNNPFCFPGNIDINEDAQTLTITVTYPVGTFEKVGGVWVKQE